MHAQIVGAPSPKLFAAMANEHTNGPKHREGPGSESTDNFITGNYGVETDSNTEWHYVTDEGATPQEVGREQWPAESEEKMPARNKCRKKVSIEALRKEKEAVNKRLEAANQTPVMDQELIAACMYTGPVSERPKHASPIHPFAYRTLPALIDHRSPCY